MRKIVQLTQSQKTMIFVLSMSLYGLSTLFTELIPKFQFGIVELSVEYFFFIPIVLAILFDPLMAALGAATGEVIFSEIMLGQFGGLGEVEKFVTVTLAIYIAGRLIKNPKSMMQVAFISLLAVVIQQALGTAVDILKVQIAVEEFEAIAGLPESVFITEGFAFLTDVIFSGTLFCMLPAMYLVPKLHGKIEPLLGLQPKTESMRLEASKISIKALLIGLLVFVVGTVSEVLSEMDWSLIDWEAPWAETSGALYMSMAVAALITLSMVVYMVNKRGRSLD